MAEGRGEDDWAILSIDYGAGFRDVICSASAISSRRSRNRLIWSTDQRTRRHRGETDRDRGPTESRTRSIACLYDPLPILLLHGSTRIPPKGEARGARPAEARPPAGVAGPWQRRNARQAQLAQTLSSDQPSQRATRARQSASAKRYCGRHRRHIPPPGPAAVEDHIHTWALGHAGQRPVGVGAASMT